MILYIFINFFLPFAIASDGGDLSKSEASDIKALMELFHHVEGEEKQDQTFREWLQSLRKKETWVQVKDNLNLYRFSMDTYRVYSMQSKNPRFANHVQNLAFVFPLSHSIETVAGEVSMLVAGYLGASLKVQATLGVIGGIIKFPGLDPLCILLFLSYPLPVVHKTVSFLRTATFTGFRYFVEKSGIRSLWEEYVFKISPLQQLMALELRGWKVSRKNGEWLLEKTGLRVSVRNIENDFFVKSVEANGFYPTDLKDLPTNIRYAVERVVIKGKKDFYIESTSNYQWQFRDRSLPWTNKLSLQPTCNHLFY